RGNANGIDLNRNFPDGAVSPIGNIFDGPPMSTAGRQVETVRVMEWSADHSFTLSANFHTGSLVVNYPYDNDGLGSVSSPSPDEDLFVHVSEAYSIHNPPMWNSPSFFHGITNGAAWYSITGGMQDWNYRYLSCNEVTIELSNIFWPAESTLPGYWADNGESMLSYFETVHMGARGVVTDAVTGSPVYASVAVEGNEHPVFTDPDVGDYHRMLLPGVYDLTFSAPGYASRTVAGVTVVDGSATALDAALVPLGAGIVFVDGEWTGEVAVEDVDSNVVLTARDSHGHMGVSNPFDVVSGPVDHFEWSTVTSPQYVDIPVAVTLTALDANGYPVTGFSGEVSLAGYVGAGTSSTLVVSEVDTDDDDCIEFTNVSGEALDVSGWQVTVYDWDSYPAPQLTYTIPAGTVCSPGAVFLLHEEGSSPGSYPNFYSGGNFYWNNELGGNPVVILLRDPSGNVMDVMCAVDGQPGSITIPIPIPADEWQGNPVPGNPDALLTYQRIGEEDGNDLGDWVTRARSTGSLNADLTVPFTGGRTPVPVTPITASFVNGVWTGEVTILGAAVDMYLVADDSSGNTGRSNEFTVELLPPVRVNLPAGATEGDGVISGTVRI
ncbi:MAG: M14 family zinc carboxypeptidase, partial [Phycisphaerae bacterium]